VRHNDVQSVSRASLEKNDKTLCTRSGGFRGIHRARKKAWNHAGADDSQRTVLQKNSASNRHLPLLKLLALGF
jgi:hypothetical protein